MLPHAKTLYFIAMTARPAPDSVAIPAQQSFLINALGVFFFALAAWVWLLTVGRPPRTLEELGMAAAVFLVTGLIGFTRIGTRATRARIGSYWGPHWFFGDIPIPIGGHSADQASEVIFTQEIQTIHSSRGGSCRRTVYILRVKGAGWTVNVNSYVSRHVARRHAESLGKVLDKPVCDATGPKPSVRRPEELDVSLRERIRARGGPKQVQHPPAAGRFGLKSSAGEVTIDLPKRPFNAIAAACGAGLGALIAYSLDLRSPAALVTATAIGAAPLVILSGIKERVRVSASSFRVTRSLFFLPWTRSMPTDELEELEAGWTALTGLPGADAKGARRAVFAMSDTDIITFGKGLSPAETEWLRDYIPLWLAS